MATNKNDLIKFIKRNPNCSIQQIERACAKSTHTGNNHKMFNLLREMVKAGEIKFISGRYSL